MVQHLLPVLAEVDDEASAEGAKKEKKQRGVAPCQRASWRGRGAGRGSHELARLQRVLAWPLSLAWRGPDATELKLHRLAANAARGGGGCVDVR